MDNLARQMLGAAGQPFCRDYDLCPAPRDGANLPLLPFLWGGNASNQGIYRSFPGSNASSLAMGGAWDVVHRPPIQIMQASIFGPSTPLMQGTCD